MSVYLILGASSDLGVELINSLEAQKDDEKKIYLAHYNTSKEKLEKIQLHNGNQLVCIQADLSSYESVENLINTIKKYTDAPTHIVHLAAPSFKYMRLKDFNHTSLIKSINIQVVSIARILQEFLPIMAKRKAHNKIVIMLTSYLLHTPPKYVMEYAIAKSALLGLMRALAADYLGKGVNINALSPSMIETKFLSNLDERIVQNVAENSPEQRNAVPKDIVPVIKFLLSDASNYLHGANLNVTNGGVI